VLSGPRGKGYLDMHLWVNQMAAVATGDWLYLFNDDARMLAEKWDLVLRLANVNGLWHGVDDVCMLVTPTEGRPFANKFFLLRRKVFGVLGHISLNPHTDSWIQAVMSMVASSLRLGKVHVRHVSHLLDDLTRKESVASYAVAGPDYNSAWAIRQRIQDAGKVLDYIEAFAVKGLVAKGQR